MADKAKTNKALRPHRVIPKRVRPIIKRGDFVCTACKDEFTALVRRETIMDHRVCHTCANKIRQTWKAPKPKPVEAS
jgi:hypothetical protein